MDKKNKKKNQHYVSQFYLKNFSINKNKKNIGAYLLNEDRFIKSTEIKNQVSDRYYYGEDGIIEERLGFMETRQSPLINKIFEKEVPLKNSAGERDLYELVALTHIRNPKIVRYFKNMVNAVANSSVYDFLGKGSLEKHAKIIGFKFIDDIVNFLVDLDYKILVNETDVPFITSDLPVVRYNKYLENFSNSFCTIAYSLVGLKVFLPLNENMCLVLYDSETYKIGNKKDKFVYVSCEKEINQINLLQVLNCESMLYFNEKFTETYAKELVAISRKKRYIDQSKKYLLIGKSYITERSINIKMNISCIKIHSKAKKYNTISNSTIPLRRKAEINAFK